MVMNINNDDLYGLTDDAISEIMGQRLEQHRLESNKSQKRIAQELGISEGTYRSAIQGKAKFKVVIGIMRVLGQLDNLKNFLPEVPYSPIALLKMAGKQRKRASSKKDNPE
jgi:putative transcriptional regulator